MKKVVKNHCCMKKNIILSTIKPLTEGAFSSLFRRYNKKCSYSHEQLHRKKISK